MHDGRLRIEQILQMFTGRDGEPGNAQETYILKSMWLMMLSEFESSVKSLAEAYIDEVKRRDISDIHVCLLVRNFHGNTEDALTLNKVVACYKRNPNEINYSNFTKDKVPKYKSAAVVKLFNNLGIFFTDIEEQSLAILNSIASTRDSIAHGDLGVQITKRELENHLNDLEGLSLMLASKLTA